MTTTVNEQLVAIRTDLSALLSGVERSNVRDMRDVLRVAFNRVAPDMSSFTATWVASMLRDTAVLAGYGGEKNLAVRLHDAAHALDNAWDGF